MRFLRPRSRELPGESRACWFIGYQQTPKILEWVPSDVKFCLSEHLSMRCHFTSRPFPDPGWREHISFLRGALTYR